MSLRLAVIGAGVAGTGAAWALRGHDADVTLFEKSRGVSGRAATRRRDGIAYDHGASFFRLDEPRVEDLVRRRLPAEDLAVVEGEVWTFDAEGRLRPGDPALNRARRWTYRGGVSTLGKLLLHASGASLRTQTRIVHLDGGPGRWLLADDAGETHGPFDAVLLTPPAPQAAELLAASALPEALGRTLASGLGQAAYRTQLSVVLGYRRRLERPFDGYALVNTDGRHPVAWLGFEADKPGRVPEGEEVLIVQMSPAWSLPRYETPADALAEEVVPLVEALLGTPLGAPDWADRQRWRYALPDRGADVEALRAGAGAGLFFAGDAVAGRGRVSLALASGLDAADSLLAALRA